MVRLAIAAVLWLCAAPLLAQPPVYWQSNGATSIRPSTTGLVGRTVDFWDSDSSHQHLLRWGNLSANRTITVDLGDANRTLTFTGDASIGGTNTGDQTITLTGDVTGSGTASFAATIAANAVTAAKIADDVIDFADITDASTLDANWTIGASASNFGINIDSNTLVVDTANNQVGIGKASPETKLHVVGGNARVDNTGVGTAIVVNRTDGVAVALQAGSGSGAKFLFDQTAVFAIQSTTKADVLLGSGTGTARLIVAGIEGNIGVGVSTFGTSAIRTFAIASGTAPASSPADAVQIYVTDFAPGDARLRIRSESTGIITLGKGTVEAAGTEAADAVLTLRADEGDDLADTWSVKSLASSNSLSFLNDVTEVASLSSGGNLQIDGDPTFSGDDLFMLTNTAGFLLVADGTSFNPVSMSGDATLSGSGALAIAADSVTYAKLQNVSAASRFVGRITAGAGDAEELTGTQATSLLDAFAGDSGAGGTKGLAPAPAAGDAAAGKFLKADGTWAVAAASVADGDKGDITVSGTGATWTVDAGAVTVSELAASTSAHLRGVLSDENGTGAALFNSATSPTFTTGLAVSSAGDALLTLDGASATFIRTKDSGGGLNSKYFDILNDNGDLYFRSMDDDAFSNIITALTLFQTGNVTVGGDLTVAGDDLVMATNTAGALLIGDGTNFNPVVPSGDLTLSGAGAFTVAANSVALTTDTTGSYAAGDAEAGNALTGDTATAFFSAGQIEAARGGTGDDTSGTTGTPRIAAGNWTYDAGISHLAASSSADLAGVISNETGTGVAVFDTSPTFTTSIDLGSAGVRLSDDGDGALTFLGLGNGSDEDLTLNLDDTANTATLSSSTGLNVISLTMAGATDNPLFEVQNGTRRWTWGINGASDFWRLTDNTAVAARLVVSNVGNIGFNTSSFGTSAEKVLALGTGVAPTTSPANAFQMYSADFIPGNAVPHFMTENGAVIKLLQNDANPNTTGASLADLEGELNQVKQLLRDNGLMAP